MDSFSAGYSPAAMEAAKTGSDFPVLQNYGFSTPAYGQAPLTNQPLGVGGWGPTTGLANEGQPPSPGGPPIPWGTLPNPGDFPPSPGLGGNVTKPLPGDWNWLPPIQENVPPGSTSLAAALAAIANEGLPGNGQVGGFADESKPPPIPPWLINPWGGLHPPGWPNIDIQPPWPQSFDAPRPR